MLKSLAIRRIFLLADIVLALCLGYAGYLIAGQALSANPPAVTEAQEAAPDEAVRPQLAKVDARTAYDPIIQNRLFGAAGQMKADEAAPPPPPPVVEVETALPLTLIGTTTAGIPTSPFGSALIRHNDTRRSDAYFVGQEVVPQVSLKEVYDRRVMLMNARTNQVEQLFMEDEKARRKNAPPVAAAPTGSAEPANLSNRVTLNKQEVMDDLFTNYADLSTKLKATLYVDERGNTSGIVAPNWTEIPLARKLNLQDGDVIQSINNEVIDSEQKVMQLLTKYRDATAIRVGILRNGQPRVLNVMLQ